MRWAKLGVVISLFDLPFAGLVLGLLCVLDGPLALQVRGACLIVHSLLAVCVGCIMLGMWTDEEQTRTRHARH